MNSALSKNNLICRMISLFTVFLFISSIIFPPQWVYSQTVLNLPLPGAMIEPTPKHVPALIRGINLNTENPLEFDFIIDTGNSSLRGKALSAESKKLIKYFLAGLTVPEEKMWVNLSPFEKGRVIPLSFGETEMGRDLLAQDYLLKQLASSMMYPEGELGSRFWNSVYKKTKEQYGTTSIPLNTFNKIWIMPQKARVYEDDKGAYIIESSLKVLLEEDYIALQKNLGSEGYGLDKKDPNGGEMEVVSGISSKALREILIPEIEKEVNQGKTFANLRQIYNSVILATWYKKALQNSLLSKLYVNKGKVAGIDIEDKEINTKIYKQYVEAFKSGVYDYIRKDYDAKSQEIMSRKYFSGGSHVDPREVIAVQNQLSSKDGAMVAEEIGEILNVTAQLKEATAHNQGVIAAAEAGGSGGPEKDFAQAVAIPPDDLMGQLQQLANVLGSSEYQGILDTVLTAMDPVAFQQNLVKVLGDDETAASKVTTALSQNSVFSPKSLKEAVWQSMASSGGLDRSLSVGTRFDVTVSPQGFRRNTSTDIKPLRKGDLYHDFLLAQYRAAKNKTSFYVDDMAFYIGRFLNFFPNKPDYYKEQQPINGQEWHDLYDDIEALKAFLRGQAGAGAGQSLKIKKIDNVISDGGGAYLRQLAVIVNQLAAEMEIPFHWGVVDTLADINRIKKDSINFSGKNTLAIDVSNGSIDEIVDFMRATTRRKGPLTMDNRIVFSNRGRVHEIGRRLLGGFSIEDLEAIEFTPSDSAKMIKHLSKKQIIKEVNGRWIIQPDKARQVITTRELALTDPVHTVVNDYKDVYVVRILKEILDARHATASVLQIDNMPENMGARHMNVKTGMVVGPLFTALSILGFKITGDLEEGFQWAENKMKLYVTQLYQANLDLSPKQSLDEPEVYNPSSMLAIEMLLKRDIENRHKPSIIFSPSLRGEIMAFFQSFNQIAVKMAAGGKRNNNMFSFWDASDEKQDYMKTISAAPNLYQPLFIIDISSESAARMSAEADQLQSQGIPVKIIRVQIQKTKPGASTQEKQQVFDHNLKTLASLTATLQTFVTTFASLADQHSNINPVDRARVFAKGINGILDERRITQNREDLLPKEKKVTFADMIRKMTAQKKASYKKAKARFEPVIAAVEEESMPLNPIFQGFINDTLQPLADKLGIGVDVVAGIFIGSVSKAIFSEDAGGEFDSAVWDIILEKFEFVSLLGSLTQDFTLDPLSVQADVYQGEDMTVTVAVPAEGGEDIRNKYKVDAISDIPGALVAYYRDRLLAESKLNPHTIGLGYGDTGERNPPIEEIMASINNSLASLGISALAMNFPLGRGIGQDLAEMMLFISLSPAQSFSEEEGQLGSLLIRDGMTVNDAMKIYLDANAARMAFGGTPTILFNYKNKKQLPRIEQALKSTMQLLAEDMRQRQDGYQQRTKDSALVIDLASEVKNVLGQGKETLFPDGIITTENVALGVMGQAGGGKHLNLEPQINAILKGLSEGDDSLLITVDPGIWRFRNLGGITLDASLLEISIQRDDRGMPLPMLDIEIENMNLAGFIPVITKMVMVPDINAHLGLDKDTSSSQKRQLSLYMELSPIDKVERQAVKSNT